MPNIQEILTEFQSAEQYEHDQRYLALKDLLFVNAEAGQWDTYALERREDRPRYTIDRISGAIDQIIGDGRKNRTAIKVEPKHDGTEETAKILTGLIRNIEAQSNSQDAYDNAQQEQITCGYAGWRILADYDSDETFEQSISIEPIHSAASSLYYDPGARNYGRDDGLYMFYSSQMQIDEFKKKYPNAQVVDFDSGLYTSTIYTGWFGKNDLRVAEYWYKEPCTRKIGLLSDNRVIDLDEEKQVLDELQEQGVTVIREREVKSYKIKMLKMTGAEILEEPQEWPGEYFPFVPLWGKEIIIEGRRFVRGLVRKAIDSQRIYNYASSAAIEGAALTPLDPYWMTAKQAEGYERQLKQMAVKNPPVMFYNADPQVPGPPQRGQPPQLQQSLLAQIQQAAGDIHATTGLEPASLGNAPDMMSGKAIQAQQAMGDRGAYIFHSNFERSLQFCGMILVDLIPRIYDTERVVKILGPDETFETITINQPATDRLNQPIIDEETGEEVIVNDLSQGQYSVHVSTGPAFATAREETVKQLTTLAAGSETIQELALDIIIDNLNINKGEELKSRVRRDMIQKGLIEPSDEERQQLGLDEPQQPNPMDVVVMRNLAAETEKIMAQIRNTDADTQKKIYESQKITVQAIKELTEAFTKKMDQGLPVTSEEQRLYQGQEAIVGETQLDTLSQAELGGSSKLAPSPADGRPTPGLNPPQR